MHMIPFFNLKSDKKGRLSKALRVIFFFFNITVNYVIVISVVKVYNKQICNGWTLE